LGGEKRILYVEADIAYCAEIYRKLGRRGRKIFDKEGLPYKSKTGIFTGQGEKGGINHLFCRIIIPSFNKLELLFHD